MSESFKVDAASVIVAPTMHYRWLIRGGVGALMDSFGMAHARVLQQAFQRSDGEIEWRDVPVVVEEPRGGSHAE